MFKTIKQKIERKRNSDSFFWKATVLAKDICWNLISFIEKIREEEYYSQLGQDKWVLEQLKFKKNGYFVDIGASNGINLSNTYILEKKYNWKGICVEPVNCIKELRKNRKCIIDTGCIFSKSNKKVKFIKCKELGGIVKYLDKIHKRKGKIVKLSTISLLDIFKKYHVQKEIDYLSIDTEGSEYEIIRTFPFEKYKIKLITVEHNTPSNSKIDSENRVKIFKLLKSKGYTRYNTGYSTFDDWYILREAK